MGECQFVLSDGKPCGAPTGGVYCPFHKQFIDGNEIRSADFLRDYLAADVRWPHDISGLRFRGINFARTLLSDGIQLKAIHTVFVDCELDSCHMGESDFDHAEFENCIFRRCTFLDRVNFKGAKFRGTTFWGVAFDGNLTSFVAAAFVNSASIFTACTFKNNASSHETPIGVRFDHASFDVPDVVYEYCCIRAKVVSWIGAAINADRFFLKVMGGSRDIYDSVYLSVCAEEIYLDGLRFNGHFEYTNHLSHLDIAPTVRFTKIIFSQMRSAAIIEANLENANFTYSVLSGLHFINPRWRIEKGRKLLKEEKEPIEQVAPEELSRVYIQLKRNFEENRDYIGASDWFYREMEARRRLISSTSEYSWWRWLRQNAVSLTPLYKYASSYGESYWRPVCILVGIYIVFSWLYLMFGFSLGSANINYDWGDTVGFRLGDIGHAFTFGALAMTFQISPASLLQSQWSFVAYVSQILLTLIFVPLFVLALRRRFRR